LRCGAPPHGGIALGPYVALVVTGLTDRYGLGFDRLMAMLCKTQSIRDVIAFPKASNGVDLLFKSPAPVNNDMLYQYGIKPR
jgi:aspartyl-tRNA synthetase